MKATETNHRFISEPVVTGTAPTNLSITVAKAKAYLGIDASDTSQDDLIQDCIEAATIQAENATGLQLSTATFIGYLTNFPDQRVIRVSKPPLVSVSSIEYYDTNNTLSSPIAATNYEVVAETTPGLIVFDEDYSFPSVYDRPDAVKVTFVAGYSASTNIPADIRKGVRALIWDEYEYRRNKVHERMTDADLLFAQYRGSGL